MLGSGRHFRDDSRLMAQLQGRVKLVGRARFAIAAFGASRNEEVNGSCARLRTEPFSQMRACSRRTSRLGWARKCGAAGQGNRIMDCFSKTFLDESIELIKQIDVASIEAVAHGLADVRAGGGRLFILGVGGSAGHAGHAVNDFRKICDLEAYAPTDNVSELTARVNDEGWDTSFSEWLKVSRLRPSDALLIFSVGGGNREKNVSVNLVKSIELAKSIGAKVFGIVGRDGGFTKQSADACVLVPTVSSSRITPHTEGMCAVIWHLLVSHPQLQKAATKWESVR